MKVEGKSRNANCVHVNAVPQGTQVFHTRRIIKIGESQRQPGHAVVHCFQLNNDSFVAGASGKVFTIQIFEQGNCILA